jgi:hypothetical protein
MLPWQSFFMHTAHKLAWDTESGASGSLETVEGMLKDVKAACTFPNASDGSPALRLPSTTRDKLSSVAVAVLPEGRLACPHPVMCFVSR